MGAIRREVTFLFPKGERPSSLFTLRILAYGKGGGAYLKVATHLDNLPTCTSLGSATRFSAPSQEHHFWEISRKNHFGRSWEKAKKKVIEASDFISSGIIYCIVRWNEPFASLLITLYLRLDESCLFWFRCSSSMILKCSGGHASGRLRHLCRTSVTAVYMYLMYRVAP